ncbi:MAG: LytTR family DNA-binding domain-containing protein [Bacteroidales bacterium]|nr:LytTR family DNA-binding domain-containing protein [Bacteroidales bacterium]
MELISTAAVAFAFAAVLTLLFLLYGKPAGTADAIVASVSYTVIFGACGYYYRYLRQYIKAPGARVVVALLVQLVSVAIAALSTEIMDSRGTEWFIGILPLLVPFGLISWLSLSLCYSLEKCEDERAEEAENETDCNGLSQNPDKREPKETISVREGNRIHIIRTEQLQYVQAYGDYVMLHTDNGKFVKEETMKNFEASLPDYFVRVHRSAIVNTRIIVRTELYGKESYTIYLSSGIKLRASASGYRLLKEKLSL